MSIKSHQHHKRVFIAHLLRNSFFGLLIILFSLFAGMLGYHHFETMSWVDAYINAAMILSGMGPLGTPLTTAGKIFAGSYAIFSGVAFLVIIALVFTPVIRWVFVKFHLDQTKK